jgi:hypothetical protein
MGTQIMLAGRLTGSAETALTLKVPTLVRSGGRSVIEFVTSGSVEPGDPFIADWQAPPSGAGTTLA